MDLKRRKSRLRHALGLVFVAALLLCPPIRTATAPPDASDADENKADEPEATFQLHGGFAQGVLLRRQEDLQYLAILLPLAPGIAPEDYQVSIDWGDRCPAARGQLVNVGPIAYAATSRHVYAAAGRYTVTVSVTDPNGATVSVRSTIEVGDLYAGIADDWTAATIPVADAETWPEDLQVILDWGDGSPAAAGMVRRDGGVVRISGRHAYAHDGPYTVSVLANDSDGVKLACKRAMRVVRPPIRATPVNVSSNPGEPMIDVELGNFRLSNPLATVREFSALIDWGDGTLFDAEAVIVGSGGEFRILGSHTYAEPGVYRVNWLLMQSWH